MLTSLLVTLGNINASGNNQVFYQVDPKNKSLDLQLYHGNWSTANYCRQSFTITFKDEKMNSIIGIKLLFRDSQFVGELWDENEFWNLLNLYLDNKVE